VVISLAWFGVCCVAAPADSLPTTSVTFWLDSMALRRALLACARKPRNEFLGTAILARQVKIFDVVVLMRNMSNEFTKDDVHAHRPAHAASPLLAQV
jgi:hypothetical protein